MRRRGTFNHARNLFKSSRNWTKYCPRLATEFPTSNSMIGQKRKRTPSLRQQVVSSSNRHPGLMRRFRDCDDAGGPIGIGQGTSTGIPPRHWLQASRAVPTTFPDGLLVIGFPRISTNCLSKSGDWLSPQMPRFWQSRMLPSGREQWVIQPYNQIQIHRISAD